VVLAIPWIELESGLCIWQSRALRILDIDAAREAMGNGDMASMSADTRQTGTWAMKTMVGFTEPQWW